MNYRFVVETDTIESFRGCGAFKERAHESILRFDTGVVVYVQKEVR